MRRSWTLLIGLSLLLSVSVPLLHGGLGSLHQLERLSLWIVVLLLGMVALGWLCNAARLRLLSATLRSPVPWGGSVGIVLAAEFASVATPAGSGGPATYLLLLPRKGLSVGNSVALMAVDHLMDLVFLITAVPLVLALFVLHGGDLHPLRLGLAGLGVLALGLAAAYWALRHYRRVVLGVAPLLHRVPLLRKRRYRLARLLIQFRAGVRLLLSMGRARLLLLYLLSAGHWSLRYSILPVLLWYLGEAAPWAYLYLAQPLLLLAGQATFLPGGGGGVELGYSVLLRPYLDPVASAFTLLTWRFFTFYWYLLAGAPAFFWLAGSELLRGPPGPPLVPTNGAP